MFWAALFLLVMFYLANSILGLVRALVDPDWYAARMVQRGLTPSFSRLLTRKAVTSTSAAFLAYWLGMQAGYFG